MSKFKSFYKFSSARAKEDGRSTSKFLLYGQNSQGRMTIFPAFIASKSFEMKLFAVHFDVLKYIWWLWKCVSLQARLMVYRVVIKSSHGPSVFRGQGWIEKVEAQKCQQCSQSQSVNQMCACLLSCTFTTYGKCTLGPGAVYLSLL